MDERIWSLTFQSQPLEYSDKELLFAIDFEMEIFTNVRILSEG